MFINFIKNRHISSEYHAIPILVVASLLSSVVWDPLVCLGVLRYQRGARPHVVGIDVAILRGMSVKPIQKAAHVRVLVNEEAPVCLGGASTKLVLVGLIVEERV